VCSQVPSKKTDLRPERVQARIIQSELDNHAAVSECDHVATLHGSFEDGDSWACAVQELCTGGSLNDLLSAGVSSLRTQQLTMRGLLHALCACNDAHVLHGDVKPSNIMFNSMSGGVRLIDFGSSARLADASTQFVRCSFGAPAYGAPEVLKSGTYTRMSDMWSAGVVLHQILTLSKLPYIVLCLDWDVNKLLDKLPTGTPATARDLLAQLLVPEQEKRMHPYEALGHPFFRM
jgi:serine/threonine protein kinase